MINSVQLIQCVMVEVVEDVEVVEEVEVEVTRSRTRLHQAAF